MREAVIVVNHIIGKRQAVFLARLSCKNPSCLLDGLGVAGQQAPDLSLLFTINDQDSVDELRQGRADQQRHNDKLVIATGVVGLLTRFRTNQGMQDGFEIESCCVVVEDHFPQGGTVQLTSRIDHVVPKSLTDFVECGLARGNDLAGNDVSIDNRNAELGKQVGHDGLAARNAAGQAYS